MTTLRTYQLYYDGDIQDDLELLAKLPSSDLFLPELRTYAQQFGFGRMQQIVRQHEHLTLFNQEIQMKENLEYLVKIWSADNLCFALQVLWAEYLEQKGVAISGAFFLK